MGFRSVNVLASSSWQLLLRRCRRDGAPRAPRRSSKGVDTRGGVVGQAVAELLKGLLPQRVPGDDTHPCTARRP